MPLNPNSVKWYQPFLLTYKELLITFAFILSSYIVFILTTFGNSSSQGIGLNLIFLIVSFLTACTVIYISSLKFKEWVVWILYIAITILLSIIFGISTIFLGTLLAFLYLAFLFGIGHSFIIFLGVRYKLWILVYAIVNFVSLLSIIFVDFKFFYIFPIAISILVNIVHFASVQNLYWNRTDDVQKDPDFIKKTRLSLLFQSAVILVASVFMIILVYTIPDNFKTPNIDQEIINKQSPDNFSQNPDSYGYKDFELDENGELVDTFLKVNPGGISGVIQVSPSGELKVLEYGDNTDKKVDLINPKKDTWLKVDQRFEIQFKSNEDVLVKNPQTGDEYLFRKGTIVSPETIPDFSVPETIPQPGDQENGENSPPNRTPRDSPNEPAPLNPSPEPEDNSNPPKQDFPNPEPPEIKPPEPEPEINSPEIDEDLILRIFQIAIITLLVCSIIGIIVYLIIRYNRYKKFEAWPDTLAQERDYKSAILVSMLQILPYLKELRLRKTNETIIEYTADIASKEGFENLKKVGILITKALYDKKENLNSKDFREIKEILVPIKEKCYEDLKFNQKITWELQKVSFQIPHHDEFVKQTKKGLV
jgi:hypothetical protein